MRYRHPEQWISSSTILKVRLPQKVCIKGVLANGRFRRCPSALQPGPEKAFRIFNGGETVHVKVMDDEGKEYVLAYGREYNYERKV